MKKKILILLLIIVVVILVVLFSQEAKILGMAAENKECLIAGLCGG
jgi:hypothetical protein